MSLIFYLQSVINQSQDVLNRLLLGDVGHQIQKGLCTLSEHKQIYRNLERQKTYIDVLNKKAFTFIVPGTSKTARVSPTLVKVKCMCLNSGLQNQISRQMILKS